MNKKIKALIIGLTTIMTTSAFATVERIAIDKLTANTVYVKFDAKKLGSFACVTQAKKSGEVIFAGVISNKEYSEKYSGFWLKDASTCAYFKKLA